ncbi:DUF5808 domain-containing protein [Microbacterium halotolerans]|uniref:DUF5808 domain-containing protein n=1 Tax=Microbacterium halotolerans TaxID=246613 RepID=UPI001968E6DC|nr:DUF5808 domain-containing protein [Microbacterium halotolerans]
MKSYLRAVGAHLGNLSRTDRLLALEGLEAQLGELLEAHMDPVEALGAPEDYAGELLDALASDVPADEPHLRVLGLPVETRGPVSAKVRSRTWNPESSRLVVPRLLGVGWTLNLGALAVRLRLIRPDDATSEVLDQVPERTVRAAQLAPLLTAGAAAGALALTWKRMPDRVASRFDILGRQNRTSSKLSMLGSLALGIVPALWAVRRQASVEDRLVSAASATTLAAVSASVVAASILSARQPRGRWGLLVPTGLILGVTASLGVIVLPLRAGLRRAWRNAKVTSDRAERER